MRRSRAGGKVRVRFAAVPSGLLHVGAARVAIANALFAARHASAMTLRLDDADPAHRDPDMAQAARTDLAWLGLPVGDVIRQSERTHLYQDTAARLEAAGRLYPCFESEEELRAKRDGRIRRGQSPIYDRAMLRLTPEQRAAAEAGGKRPYWRFRLSGETVGWDDGVLGPCSVKLGALSDPVAIRADGCALPVFTSVVDDLDLGVTHVIRGNEHCDDAGIQLDLRAALGDDRQRVAFAHLPALTDAGGGRLSRRDGNVTVRSLRQHGIEPAALVGLLARLGSADEPRPSTFADLAAAFDLSALSRAPPRFHMTRLLSLNRAVLRETPFAEVAGRLPPGATEAFWLAVRGSLDMLAEARGWWEVVAGTIVPPVLDGEEAVLGVALDLVPPEPWDEGVWEAWVAAIGAVTGQSGRAVKTPLRLAITGEEDGPAFASLLPLIGRSRVMERLRLAAR